MNNYLVYVKSHSEAPDFEAEYTEEELEARICQIPYAEDSYNEDGVNEIFSTKCGGKLEEIPQGYKCKSCEQSYEWLDEESPEQLREKAELLHDDYLEAEATGN